MNTEVYGLVFAAPELWIGAIACLVLLLDAYLPPAQRPIGFWLTQAGLVGAAVLTLATYPGEPILVFGGMLVIDEMAVLLKVATYIAVFMLLAYSWRFLQEWQLDKGEYLVLVLLATLGMMVMISGQSLLTIYLGLELLSLSLYALVAFNRDNGTAAEAGMKYFVLGAMASGMLLYGMSLLYGMTISLNLHDIAVNLAQLNAGQGDGQSSEQGVVAVFALVFILIGLAFKLGAVPFHNWLPDVYHGAPAPVTLLVATAPKLAAFAITIRLLLSAFGELQADWQPMLVLMAVLSLLVGNLIAIAQRNIKRMLAYSTIGHIGFVLLGLLTGVSAGYTAALFYVLIYTLMGLGGFGIVVLLSRNGYEAQSLDDYRGLAEREAWLAFLLALIMFSMAGIPPTVGFYAKLVVLQALLQVGQVWLAVFAVVLSVVGAYYYLRVVKLMFMDSADRYHTGIAPGWQRSTAILMSANGLAMLFLGLFPSGLMQICHRVVQSGGW